MMPTTRSSASRTGTAPQSFSHMICAAVARVSLDAQVRTSRVMRSSIFTDGTLPPCAILRVLDFHAYAEQPDDELDLLEGALLIAKDAYPGLEPAEVEADLDALAEPLVAARVAAMPAPIQAR